MGRFSRRPLSATFALGLLFVSAPPQSVAAADPYNVSAQQTLINQDRAQNGGLPALAWNNCLANIAQQNADRIAAQGSLSHTNGPTLDLACLPGATYAGENIAFTSRGMDDAQVNTMFMNSAPHRANILGTFTLVGTAWTVAPNGYGYIAEEFLNAPAPVPDPFRAMFTIDAFGGVHGDGGTLPQAVTSYWPNWRIANAAALLPDASGHHEQCLLAGLADRARHRAHPGQHRDQRLRGHSRWLRWSPSLRNGREPAGRPLLGKLEYRPIGPAVAAVDRCPAARLGAGRLRRPPSVRRRAVDQLRVLPRSRSLGSADRRLDPGAGHCRTPAVDSWDTMRPRH